MTLTTVQVGRLVGYSTQQVRDLERLRVIPAAVRGVNGYRRYDQRHVIALRAYRALAAAVGPVSARRLMPGLVDGSLARAAEAVDDLHAELARERGRVRDALAALDAVLADAPAVFDVDDSLSIGELAQALGIRPSALRHWEHEGLVRPDRATATGARRYGAEALAAARIVAALREGGYPIPPIRSVLEPLRAHGLTADARRLLDDRLDALTRRSMSLLAASGYLHDLLAVHSEARSRAS